ncbi:hypothetical protein CR513_44557, partial [Mucuna pruriens]
MPPRTIDIHPPGTSRPVHMAVVRYVGNRSKSSATDYYYVQRLNPGDEGKAIEQEIGKLKVVCFIKEVSYTTWLSNVVLIKKSNEKRRIWVVYSNLNKVCPKDSYPLSSIDRLVDGASGFQVFSFLDAYSGYNHIKIYPPNANKTAFMTDDLTYYYQVRSFDLKNAGATYQRLMDKVFANHIDRNLEVYVDNMGNRGKPRQMQHNHPNEKSPKCKGGTKVNKTTGFAIVLLTKSNLEGLALLPTPKETDLLPLEQ